MKKRLNRLYSMGSRLKKGQTLTIPESIEYESLLNEAKAEIDRVEDDHTRLVLTERYINANKWSDIADKMGHYTDDGIRKCCERAVKKYLQKK